MRHDYADRYILITGAGRGLGKHLAHHLAGFGATVGVADIDGGNARDTAAAIHHAGGCVATVKPAAAA
jgi:NAD(P)-dependent dehydrogenase (short-subunit alcohol dehydrogenase family)